MKLVRALALAVLALLGCERHRPAVIFPPRGVDVEVRVKVGKDALQGGTSAAPVETPPSRCACSCGAACSCRKEER